MLASGLLLAIVAACAGGPRSTMSGPDPARYGHPTPGDPWGHYIRAAADRFDVPETWIRTVMQIESGGRTTLNGRPITSHAGAMGLMQLMPATFEELRRKHGLGPDPHDPWTNVLAGTAYIREMYDLFGSPGFLAAYNCGPGCYGRYLAGQRSLPRETRNYLAMAAARVVGQEPRIRVAAAAPAPTTLARRVEPVRPAPRVEVARATPPPVPPRQTRRAPVAPGGWGVQVGAFSTPEAGGRAAERARRMIADLLPGAQVQIAAVATASGTLYRARLVGLSEQAASTVCARLINQGAACVPVSAG